MKGTLFSADFIKDSAGNLRLLELNTDTAVLESALPLLELGSFLDTLVDNAITKVSIINKPSHHFKLTNQISASIAEYELLSVTEITVINEPENGIYPTAVTDEDDRFILRLAYDEAAVLDSTYCKNSLNTYKLFVNADTPDSSSIASFYHSSSAEGNLDYLERELVGGVLPDLALKNISDPSILVKFVKLGSEVADESAADRFDYYINHAAHENNVITQYHYNSGSLVDNKIGSIRSVNIIYGPELNLINLATYNTHATFALPTEVPDDYSENRYINEFHQKHYYEYATNFIKFEGDFHGILSTHQVLKSDGTYTPITDVVVGDTLSSYFISGSPDSEVNTELFEWSASGNEFPSGSYLTSSLVITKREQDLNYGALNEIVVDGEAKYLSTRFSLLVYNSGSDSISYKAAIHLDPNQDYLMDVSGSLIDIDEASVYITSDTTTTLTELDVEDTDTYIISGSTSFNSVVAHNSPCFVAGTEITLENDDVKNIEDVVVGDSVLTYNHESNETEYKLVEQIISKNVESTVKYSFENGKELEATLDHPLYSSNGEYVSFNPNLTKEKYGLSVGQIEVGTPILVEDGSSLIVSNIVELTEPKRVYNLNSVKDNHNFYANTLLVHNRCFVAGTKITLSDDSEVNIEDVVVGESVLTYNEASKLNEAGIVGDLKKHEVSSVIRLTLDNENIIVTTTEHPFFVEGEWIKAGQLKPLDVCKKVDGSESIISTVDVLEETHVVYNLLSVSDNSNFYANGILVHNKV
tara:strand:- start:3279 stop:5549 length:2271 start_codon:yes stop_codon:yes gene_type:complete